MRYSINLTRLCVSSILVVCTFSGSAFALIEGGEGTTPINDLICTAEI